MIAREGTPKATGQNVNGLLRLSAEVQLRGLLHRPRPQIISSNCSYSTSLWMPKNLSREDCPPKRIFVTSWNPNSHPWGMSESLPIRSLTIMPTRE